MAQSIKKVDYYAAQVPNKRGEAARALSALAESNVNLLAFTGFPTGNGRSQLDFVPEDGAAFRAAARRAGIKVRPRKTGFVVMGDDRPGAIARVLKRLADARINVTAVDAVCAGKGRYGAILWVRPTQVRKAAKALGAR
jgi:hypothetical protein